MDGSPEYFSIATAEEMLALLSLALYSVTQREPGPEPEMDPEGARALYYHLQGARLALYWTN